MRKKIYIVAFVICMMCGMAACGKGDGAGDAVPNERINVKIAHASSEDSATQVVCEAFKEKAVELLGDRVTVEIYPNATLGSEAEMVEALQMGTLDAGTFGRHSAIDSRMEILNLPFLFADDEHVRKVLRGEEGEAVREKLYQIMLENQIVALGWYETGFREITSNKQLETLDDLNGLLIRTPSTDTLIKAFQAWGASPTAVDLSELYTALQSGVVDAQENPYQLIDTNNLYEVQKYLCVTNHLTIPNQLVFSRQVWESYPEDVQEAFLAAGDYACNAGGTCNVEQNSSLLEELETRMTITYMEEESLKKMEAIAVEKVWPQFISENDGTRELVDEIQAMR
ncbi:MAG: TRAP transporter substrate-binding protein [Lachnospiraceae bacterium]|nr:TRAP transporter substrate-binding protein [Lachnospiraceae bacterium]